MQYYFELAMFIGLKILFNIDNWNIGKMSYQCNTSLKASLSRQVGQSASQSLTQSVENFITIYCNQLKAFCVKTSMKASLGWQVGQSANRSLTQSIENFITIYCNEGIFVSIVWVVLPVVQDEFWMTLRYHSKVTSHSFMLVVCK